MNESELFAIIPDKPDAAVYRSAKSRFDAIAKPIDGFGRFEDIICSIAAMRGEVHPDISKKALVIMIADNGVVKEGVSQSDSSVTASVAALMAKRRSSVGVLTKGYPVDIIPIDVGIDSDHLIDGVIDKKVSKGTGNLAKESAMTVEECLEAINVGIDTVKQCRDRGYGIIATGEMGIGNTTTATALYCTLTGRVVSSVAGRGAGLTDEGLSRKIAVIEDALLFHGLGAITPDPSETLLALSKVGGLDIAALAGVFIGCAICRIPAVIDGAISAVSALAADMMVPGCRDYMLASHRGKEKITKEVHDMLGLSGIIDAGMALGEGTGAVMMFPLLDMMMSVYNDGTSFIDTKIGQYERYEG